MPIQEHEQRFRDTLSSGNVDGWNQWRQDNPTIVPNLRGIHVPPRSDKKPHHLQGIDLHGAHISDWAHDNTAFWGVDFSNANLQNAKLASGAYYGCIFKKANLAGANLAYGDFTNVHFDEANLQDATLDGANFHGTHLRGADLSRASLIQTRLAHAYLEGATLQENKVWGVSAWGVTTDDKTSQKELIIQDGDHHMTIDDIELAQFTYLLLKNEKVRQVIDATTSKIILILGRFTKQRLTVLKELRQQIGAMNYVPMLFDFKPSQKRDLTETVILMASLSRGVIADITDAKSVPQELSHVVNNLPSVPVQPILAQGSRAFGMFEHWRRYPWVLEQITYDENDISTVGNAVMKPMERYFEQQQLSKQIQQLMKTLPEIEDQAFLSKVKKDVAALMEKIPNQK